MYNYQNLGRLKLQIQKNFANFLFAQFKNKKRNTETFSESSNFREFRYEFRYLSIGSGKEKTRRPKISLQSFQIRETLWIYLMLPSRDE